MAIINFLIIAFVVFMLVKMVNKAKGPEPEAEPAGPSQEDLLADILAALKK
jgi:large conductance mechanosensitive channel